ncbi:DUF5011 domain-containing protein [Pueribacillus sp. YX66]|uniref:DUF5011 domain-containing protein n=1 Tax=Pueribacillus sp. YX66 TaxID=3229242 RepID=UPI00358CEAEE
MIFEYGCGIVFPGIEPSLEPVDVIFNATAPQWVKAGEEFYLNNVSIAFNWNYSDEHAIFEGINFKINSENDSGVIHKFLDNNAELNAPSDVPRPVKVPLTPEGGVEVGPFIAGEVGEVILKTDEIRMNVELDLGMPLTIGFTCLTQEREFVLAKVLIDNEAPVISLNGDNPMTIKQGDPYEEPGATAQDNLDGDLTGQIKISGDVDTDTIGTYTVTYTVSDSVGNETTVERTVNIVEPFGSWYTGEGPPNDIVGNNGDSYLDTTTGDVYKREPDTWTKIGNLKGDDGKRGSAILTSSGAPSADAGDIGDLYLDTNTGNVYEKTANGWKKIANLQGPAGPQGQKGPKGSAGSGGGSGSGDDGGGTGKTKTSTSSDTDGKGKSSKGGKLPKTATSLPTLMLIGSFLVVIGSIVFVRRRKAIE